LDTEFLRDKTYWPLLCILQIKTARKTFIFDFLEKDKFDLSKLKKIFENKKILKVIHSCKQDLEVIFLNFNSIINPVFDTQIAYSLISEKENIGYTSLVKTITRISLNKDHQVSDWKQRPLSNMQLQYAVNDVRYLSQIYNFLSKELIKKKKKKTFNEEIRRLNKIKDIYKIENAWKKIKIKKRKSIDLKLLKSCAKWREKKAQSLNLPRNWIVSDKIIIKAAKKINTSELREFSKNKKINSYLNDFILFLKTKKFV
jgi:ribonuclease D